MKQVDQALLDYLHTCNNYYMCDLYEIKLADTTLRYADYDRDLTLPDERVFLCNGPIFKRGKIKLTGKIEVDQLKITVYVDKDDKINGVPMMHLAHNGGFDDAEFTLLRCFMSKPGVVIGAVEMFTGFVGVESAGGLEMEWRIMSELQKLNVSYPTRKYYQTCPFSIFDANCGLNQASYTVTGTVTAVQSPTVIVTDLTFPEGYYDNGGIQFTGGDLTGVVCAIKSSQNQTLTLLVAPDGTVKPGDTFTAVPGCNKTPETCKNKFNNFSRNRATPYIPLKETLI